MAYTSPSKRKPASASTNSGRKRLQPRSQSISSQRSAPTPGSPALLQARGDQEVARLRQLAHEELEHRHPAHALVMIGLEHGELVEVGEQRALTLTMAECSGDRAQAAIRSSVVSTARARASARPRARRRRLHVHRADRVGQQPHGVASRRASRTCSARSSRWPGRRRTDAARRRRAGCRRARAVEARVGVLPRLGRLRMIVTRRAGRAAGEARSVGMGTQCGARARRVRERAVIRRMPVARGEHRQPARRRRAGTRSAPARPRRRAHRQAAARQEVDLRIDDQQRIARPGSIRPSASASSLPLHLSCLRRTDLRAPPPA